MLKKILATDTSVNNLIIRLGLGIVMFPHGAQKMLGWFGGFGFTNTANALSGMIPYFIAVLVILIEFFGALGLIFGFFTRLSALGIAVVMTGAALKLHIHNGFFMNWMGKQAGEGFEFHILTIAMAVVLMIWGGGKLSVDGMISKKD